MTVSDQHQPASSRATATLAITGRFFLAVNCTHCQSNRSLPACPRRRASTGAYSHLMFMTDRVLGR